MNPSDPRWATAPRWQKVFSDLWSNRARSLLVVASIAVGLFAIGIIITLYSVVAQDMRASYTSVNPANIYIQAEPFDQALLDSLHSVKDVRQIEGVRVVDLRVLDHSGSWTAIRLQAVADWSRLPINRLSVVAGAWPPEDGEVVLDQYKFPDLGLNLGQALTLDMGDDTTRRLTVSGKVQDLTVGAFSGGGGFFNAPVMGYVTQATLDQLGQADPYLYNGVYATVSGSGSDLPAIRDVAARIVDKIENSGISVQASKSISSYDHPTAYLINAIVGVLLVLGLLVVFLSGFLITSTLQSLLAQQVLQIGIMKSVGARRIQIAGIYMIMILVLGLLALLIAVPLAAQLSFMLLDFLAWKLNFVLQGWRIVWPAVLFQAALALIMPQIAAWQPIQKGTSISVQEALSGMGAGEGQAKKQGGKMAEGGKMAGEDAAEQRDSRSSRIGRLVGMSRPLLIATRNTFRHKGRLALTLLTLTLGGAIFIATFNVQVSMSKYIDQIGRYFLSDVNLSLEQPYRINKIKDYLYTVPGVGYVEGWASARCELVMPDGSAGDSVELIAPPADSKLVKPVLMEGRWVQPGDTNAIALGELFRSRFPDLKVGDPFELQVNGEKTDWVVVGFFQFAGKNGGYSAYTSYDYLSRLTGTSNQAVTFQINGEKQPLTSAEQDALARAVQTRLEEENILISNLTTGSYLTGIAGSGFGVLTLFLLFMAVLTALVGSIGLAGTMSMNVMERTREIGVMRAIGASDNMLLQMVLLEGLLIGAISYVLGALLSFPISKLMSDGIAQAVFDAPSSFGFTLTGFVIWLVVVIVLSFVASFIPARSASRLTIREVLAYE